ncbi:hypothetical protein J2S34_003675 [Nitrobacter winogradskyi]|uniref:Uncharacterized protein n=1 Tax=Nitrobacter winogradskyi TaxID=913 RepID=A0ACC6AP30_NITWI|nr:hypothetical protein [Nitrobacter winogradskyi]
MHGLKPAEAGADYDDMMTILGCRRVRHESPASAVAALR